MFSRRTLIRTVIAVAVIGAPGSARATTLTFTGAVSPSDPVQTGFPFVTGQTSCAPGAAPHAFSARLHHDAYAFRNRGPADCITVRTVAGPCGDALQPTTYLGTFSPLLPSAGFAGGSDGGSCSSPPSGAEQHQASIPAGRTFVVSVHPTTASEASTPYTLDVTGASPVVAQAVNVTGGGLPKGNTLDLDASSLQDGSAPEGIVSVKATSGSKYSGPVTCLRADGDRASVLMRIRNGNTPAEFAGAVFWLEEQPNGLGGQRNRLLTAAELARYGGTCPDPNAPLGGSFNALTAGYASVIDTPGSPPVG